MYTFLLIIYTAIKPRNKTVIEYYLPSVYTLGVTCLLIPNQETEQRKNACTEMCARPFHILSVLTAPV